MSKGEKTRMNVTLSSCFVLRGLQTPKGITGVGAIPCGRPYINGQGRATAPTYTTPSFRIYNPKAILIRILKSL